MNPIRHRPAGVWQRARTLEVRVANPLGGERRGTRGRDEAEAARLIATRGPSSRAPL
jgi:hypothetical protein